ncbi:hypothetical protein ACIQ1H_07095 [Lysinibacillus sp. NPDC097279]|uniref:hypothetical protein n=1 Tax=Lysinibacillus sp. NPDC097279 TaxID=3364143 RepID=UPI0038077E9E
MYIKQEFKRALLSKMGLITIASSILLVFIGMLEALIWINSGVISIVYAFLQGYNAGTASYIVITFPIIACMPFANSYRTDIQTGFHHYIRYRMKKSYYMTIRLAVNALAGGVVVAIGPIIGFTFLMALKLLLNVPMLRPEQRLEPVLFFQSIGVSSSIMMIIMMIGIMFCCGMIFATLGLGISGVIQNKYIAIFIPFIYLIVSVTVLAKIHPALNAMALFDVDVIDRYNIGQTFLYGVVLVVVGMTLFFIGGAAKIEERFKE